MQESRKFDSEEERSMVYSAKRMKTEALIKRTFLEIYRERDISRITVKDICGRAGINRSTFYDHYTDAFDLRERIEAETIDMLQERFREKMPAGNDKEVGFAEKIMELVEIAHENDDIPFLLMMKNSAAYTAKILDVIESGALFDVSEMTGAERLRIRIAVEYHFAGVVSVLSRYAGNEDTDAVIKTLAEIADTGAAGILMGHIK